MRAMKIVFLGFKRLRQCVRCPGAHILSGNVLEPRALTELIPEWKAEGAPLHVPATDDRHLLPSCLFMQCAWHL